MREYSVLIKGLTVTEPSMYVCLCIITDVSVADVKPSSQSLFMAPSVEDGVGRLLRLDSSVDMKLGDLGGMNCLHNCLCYISQG